ncbi:serine hydrolase [Marivirga lumbricoides]|uniref:Serine hydrolase n=1 Tax=Marivirga lumbricoides TaxID=1046115 RepID=A0A2T4DUD9_9BACT|nr:serine hydrolase [Marivirga lumbricoides]
MKKLKTIGAIAFTILAWTVFIGMGFINGYLLQSIKSNNTAEGFIEACNEYPEKEFLGSQALVLIEGGKVAAKDFYSLNEAVDDQTVFPVASISKWVTAWGVMKLVQEGKLALDAPADQYLAKWHLPKSNYDNDEVTIRRLLSHSSGVISDIETDRFNPQPNTKQPITDLLMLYKGDNFITFEPGTQYAYSNIGYAILQLVIEEVTKQNFADYMQQTVFKPLQMSNSTFSVYERADLNFAQLYDEEHQLTSPNTHVPLAAGGLFTSVKDLSTFMLAHIEPNPVLSQQVLDLMLEAQTYINGIAVYGLGPDFYSQSDEDSKIIGHDGVGGIAALNTAARIDLQSHDGIIIIRMGSYYTASEIADEWMFWKAGIADRVVMERNIPFIITILIIGYILIISISIWLIRKRKRTAAI